MELIRYMSLFGKIRTFWSVIHICRYSALLLFLVMLAASFTESLGLGMVLPLLEVVTNPTNSSSAAVQYLSPILKHFSTEYWLMVIGGLFAVMFLIKNVLFILQTSLSARFVYRLREAWSLGAMDKYMHAEYPFLLSKKQGALLNDLITEPARAAKSLQKLIEFASNAILSFFLYVLLLFANWKITLLITLVGGIIIFLVRKVTYYYSMGVGHKKLTLSRQMTALGAESISAIRQIKIFSLEKETCKKFALKLNHLMNIFVRFSIIRSLPKPVAESLVAFSIVAVLVYLQYIGETPPANIVPILGLFVIISHRLVPVISKLYTEWMNILAFIPSLKLVHNLYISKVDREELEDGVVVDQLRNDIVCEDIYFSYDRTNQLFKGLNIVIPKGKVTAIVGPSGSGKSTIVDLLMGFVKQEEGNILINDLNLKEINLHSWRRLIGFVSQDTFLFNATVKENILVGKPDASEAEIIAAAKKSNADYFIKELPKGYDTILGDRGSRISGGQRQRIAIARALLRDPEVLIFDEAMSAVDAGSESLIQESINDLSREKTILIISHRLSTVKGADVIYVLDNGRIVESGTFEQLLNNKGLVWNMQTG